MLPVGEANVDRSEDVTTRGTVSAEPQSPEPVRQSPADRGQVASLEAARD
jgi:hypothetical protein